MILCDELSRSRSGPSASRLRERQHLDAGRRCVGTHGDHGDDELVAIKGVISDAEQTDLEAYLKTKYGL